MPGKHGPNQTLRCPGCRTRYASGLLLAIHELKCKRPICRCNGYQFTHRPGARYCHENPFSLVNVMAREGATDEECEAMLKNILHDLSIKDYDGKTPGFDDTTLHHVPGEPSRRKKHRSKRK